MHQERQAASGISLPLPRQASRWTRFENTQLKNPCHGRDDRRVGLSGRSWPGAAAARHARLRSGAGRACTESRADRGAGLPLAARLAPERHLRALPREPALHAGEPVLQPGPASFGRRRCAAGVVAGAAEQADALCTAERAARPDRGARRPGRRQYGFRLAPRHEPRGRRQRLEHRLDRGWDLAGHRGGGEPLRAAPDDQAVSGVAGGPPETEGRRSPYALAGALPFHHRTASLLDRGSRDPGLGHRHPSLLGRAVPCRRPRHGHRRVLPAARRRGAASDAAELSATLDRRLGPARGRDGARARDDRFPKGGRRLPRLGAGLDQPRGRAARRVGVAVLADADLAVRQAPQRSRHRPRRGAGQGGALIRCARRAR